MTIKICKILDKLISNKKISSHINLIKYIKDRPGHDLKYALNTNKINSKIKWYPKVDFEIGLLKTIKWYISENKFKY